jgi:hypothetical protein
MTAVTNKVFKGSESWLTKERQKVENFSEEIFQKFSTECQQEVDWLRKYLQDIISNATKAEKKGFLDISNQVTDNEFMCDTASIYNNVEITISATQQTRSLVVKHTPKPKHKKPEIKSLILAAAAAKRVNSKLIGWFYIANINKI